MFGFVWFFLKAFFVVALLCLLWWSFARNRPKYEFQGIPGMSKMIDQAFGIALQEDSVALPVGEKPAVFYPTESKGERESRRVLEEAFGVPFPNRRPDLLRNPETGRNLEFDGYNADLKLAFEYNGKHHTEGEGKTFLQQAKRDLLKLDLADRAGVYLITIPHTVPLKEIQSFIYDRIPASALPFVKLPNLREYVEARTRA